MLNIFNMGHYFLVIDDTSYIIFTFYSFCPSIWSKPRLRYTDYVFRVYILHDYSKYNYFFFLKLKEKSKISISTGWYQGSRLDRHYSNEHDHSRSTGR